MPNWRNGQSKLQVAHPHSEISKVPFLLKVFLTVCPLLSAGEVATHNTFHNSPPPCHLSTSPAGMHLSWLSPPPLVTSLRNSLFPSSFFFFLPNYFFLGQWKEHHKDLESVLVSPVSWAFILLSCS